MSNSTIILLLSLVLCVPLGVGMIFWGIHTGKAAGMQPFPAVPVTGAAASNSLGERLKPIARAAAFPLFALVMLPQFLVAFRRRVGRPVSKETSTEVFRFAFFTLGLVFSAMFVQMFAAQLPFQHFPNAEPGALAGSMNAVAIAAPYVSLLGFLLAAIAAGPLAFVGIMAIMMLVSIGVLLLHRRLTSA